MSFPVNSIAVEIGFWSGRRRDGIDQGVRQELRSLKMLVGMLSMKLSTMQALREVPETAPPPPIESKAQPAPELPQWADARAIEERVGLRVARLYQWVRSGWVRKAKLGETRQAGALYCVDDIREALQRIAGGMAPRKKRTGS